MPDDVNTCSQAKGRHEKDKLSRVKYGGRRVAQQRRAAIGLRGPEWPPAGVPFLLNAKIQRIVVGSRVSKRELVIAKQDPAETRQPERENKHQRQGATRYSHPTRLARLDNLGSARHLGAETPGAVHAWRVHDDPYQDESASRCRVWSATQRSGGCVGRALRARNSPAPHAPAQPDWECRPLKPAAYGRRLQADLLTGGIRSGFHQRNPRTANPTDQSLVRHPAVKPLEGMRTFQPRSP